MAFEAHRIGESPIQMRRQDRGARPRVARCRQRGAPRRRPWGAHQAPPAQRLGSRQTVRDAKQSWTTVLASPVQRALSVSDFAHLLRAHRAIVSSTRFGVPARRSSLGLPNVPGDKRRAQARPLIAKLASVRTGLRIVIGYSLVSTVVTEPPIGNLTNYEAPRFENRPQPRIRACAVRCED